MSQPTHRAERCAWPREPDARPGDFVVMATRGFVGRCIRVATGGWCNHVAVVVDLDDRGIVVSQETPGGGDVLSHLQDLDWTALACITYDCSNAQRQSVIEAAVALRGSRYGFAPCAADLLGRLGLSVALTFNDHENCSAATSRVAERTGWICPKDPDAMTPIDFARAWSVPTFG